MPQVDRDSRLSHVIILSQPSAFGTLSTLYMALLSPVTRDASRLQVCLTPIHHLCLVCLRNLLSTTYVVTPSLAHIKTLLRPNFPPRLTSLIFLLNKEKSSSLLDNQRWPAPVLKIARTFLTPLLHPCLLNHIPPAIAALPATTSAPVQLAHANAPPVSTTAAPAP
jgi:hypothetical protein